jgi:hypothetical protein
MSYAPSGSNKKRKGRRRIIRRMVAQLLNKSRAFYGS